MLELTYAPLSLDAVFNAVADRGAGGVVFFVGTVRDETDGEAVDALEYEAYRAMAKKQIEHIEDEIISRWDIKKVFVAHRLGCLKPGEMSVIIGASAAHRHEAFEACRYMIEQIKKDVPIWKKEIFQHKP